MMTLKDTERMFQALVARGFTREKAENYVVWIGDTIEVDQKGLWVVRDENGKIIDRIEAVVEE